MPKMKTRKHAEFEKLYKELISDLAPEGPPEHDIVATIARFLWRKQRGCSCC
jgi:hypothetical protein